MNTVTPPTISQRFLAVLAGLVLLLVSSVFGASSAYGEASLELFLQGDGVPRASATPAHPPATPLPNWDPGRDDHPGLTIQPSGKGFAENSADKYQLWLLPSGLMSAKKVKITIWSAFPEFRPGPGVLNGYLADCDADGNDCHLIASGKAAAGNWSPSGSWNKRSIDFGNAGATIGVNRRFGVKLVAGDESADEMWLAYGVADFPAAVSFTPIDDGGTTTTTTPSTVPPSTATTTTITTTSTTTTLPAATTTTLPAATTTTLPAATTTTTVPGAVTTTTTAPRTAAPATTTSTAVPAAPESSPAVNTQSAEADGTEAEEATKEDSTNDDDGAAIMTAGDGVDPGSGDALLAALAVPSPGASDAPPQRPTVATPISGHLIEGSSGVLPPSVAGVLFSPLMILELLLRAVTEAGRAILLPALLLALATAAAVSRGWASKPASRSA